MSTKQNEVSVGPQSGPSETPTDITRRANRELLPKIKAYIPELLDWMAPLGRFGANIVDAAVLAVPVNEQGSADPQSAGAEVRVRLRLFSERYSYGVSVCVPADGSRPEEPFGYLGCVASNRKPRAGEDWTRGRDLADGPYCEKTWHNILADIVAFELVRLGY